MKKKKGFVFVETLVVISVLAISLIVVYRSFNTSLSNEKRRLNQDNPVYLYRTKYLRDFLYEAGINNYMLFMENNPETLFQSISCSAYIDNAYVPACELLFAKSNENFDYSDVQESIGINNAVIVKGKFKDRLDNLEGDDAYQLSKDSLDYLRTIPENLNPRGYILLVEYKDQCYMIEEGGVESYFCQYNYASLNIDLVGAP